MSSGSSEGRETIVLSADYADERRFFLGGCWVAVQRQKRWKRETYGSCCPPRPQCPQCPPRPPRVAFWATYIRCTTYGDFASSSAPVIISRAGLGQRPGARSGSRLGTSSGHGAIWPDQYGRTSTLTSSRRTGRCDCSGR